MGLHSYLCPCCNKNIRMGEPAILFHIRHKEILGKSIGIYDGYGRVSNTSEFNRCNNSINSHAEMCTSCYELEDSGKTSGISAWHIPCYKKSLRKNKKLLSEIPISESDDKQGYGKLRDKYSDIKEYIEFLKEWEKE